MNDSEKTAAPVLDEDQLHRIQSVHRGFLYQHLYAATCLLLAQEAGATSVVVERDEDIEVVLPKRRLYVQVKTRSDPLKSSDIESAIDRFDRLRLEHGSGARQGSAEFVIAANITPGPALLKRYSDTDWPKDVTIHWPGKSGSIDSAVPAPQPDLNLAFDQCAGLAATLPYAMLTPETLTWKLAGAVMAAAAGSPPRHDHAFHTSELPSLFEQLILQLQDIPAPPRVYRSLTNEPLLEDPDRVRLITGYSGSGKTSWISQAAIHAGETVFYLDVVETPGPALASALARELAARLFGKSGGGLGEILIPGATGPEILHTIGQRLSENGNELTIVLDNAHVIPPSDLQMLVNRGEKFRFILLGHPGRNMRELETVLGLTAESLQGWDADTIAQEVAARNCKADYRACQRLADLTGGLPLYVQNAVAIVADEYDGSIARFCDELENQTHVVETAQELILSRIFVTLVPSNRDAVGVLSLLDVPLERKEATALLTHTLGTDEIKVAALLRELRSGGLIEVYGGGRLKIHDAMRLLGQNHLASLNEDTVREAQLALKDILVTSLEENWEFSKLSFFLRVVASVGDVKTLVQLGTDELFHELGFKPEIMESLESAANSEDTDPNDRFWALDGLLFADMKQGDHRIATEHQEAMDRLVSEFNLGPEERLAVGMKRMNLLAVNGDPEGVLASIRDVAELLPDTPQHQRIFRYNAANALFHLGQFDAVVEEAGELVREYYEVLGIGPEHVLGRNPDEIWPLLSKSEDLTDNLKHLADCLDLHAQAMNAVGSGSPFGRLHAMKFYQMASAPDSLLRVGQDVVDEFVGRHDFVGAREFIETNLLPNVLQLKLLSRTVPIRSQYAVVLAYCCDFEAAEAEMERLSAYEAGLDEKGQWELRNQRRAIARIRREGPPPQWQPEIAKPKPIRRQKVGRNAPCPCGSGKKYKKCHGRNA